MQYREYAVVSIVMVVITTMLTLVSSQPMDAKRLRSLAQHALNTHKYTEATDLYSKAIAVEPGNVDNYYARASTYLRRRKYANVLQDLGLALAVDPSFLKAYLLQARINTMRGNCDEAVAGYEAVLRLKPQHARATKAIEEVRMCAAESKLAEAAVARGDHQKVYEHVTAAVAVATESPRLFMMRAHAQVELGRPDGVLEDTRVVLQANENDLEALLLRGTYYYRMGDTSLLELALTHFRRGLKLDPEHKAIKRVYKMARKIQRYLNSVTDATAAEAKELYENVLLVDPTNVNLAVYVRTELCRLYVNKLKDGYLAEEMCGELLREQPNDISLLKLMAGANLLADNFDEAIRNYESVLKVNQQDGEAREGINRAKVLQKRASRKDYYKILGVRKGATASQIKKAYRKKALELHPDKHPEEKKAAMEKLFIDVGESYEVLSNDEKRGRYDRGEDVEVQQNPHQHFNHFQNFQQGHTFTFHM